MYFEKSVIYISREDYNFNIFAHEVQHPSAEEETLVITSFTPPLSLTKSTKSRLLFALQRP